MDSLPPPPPPSSSSMSKRDVIILLIVSGLVLIGIGMYLKDMYETRDKMRTTFDVAKIDEIVGYDVEYRSLLTVDRVPSVPVGAIKSVGTFHYFKKKEGGKVVDTVLLPITSVTKERVSDIKVTLGSDKTVKQLGSKTFVREIKESDVGSQIDIEYDKNDMTNISMAVEGMTREEKIKVWVLVGLGVIFWAMALGVGLKKGGK
jgi:hypothetical protein